MSGGKETTKQSTNQTWDPYSRARFDEQMGNVRSQLDQPYMGDWGATEFSDSEVQAGSLINNSIGSYTSGLNEARDSVNAASYITPQNFSDFDADTYVNPYADDMISSVTGDINEAAERSRTQITADTLSNGAYGGSRHGVREGMLDETTLDAVADASAGIRFNTWDAGADRFYQDVNNDLGAQQYNSQLDINRGGMLADLTAQERAFEGEDISRLMEYGATERAIEDTAAGREYADYWQRIQAEMGLLNSIPIYFDSDGEQTSSYSPGGLDYLNTGANIFSTFWGTPGT